MWGLVYRGVKFVWRNVSRETRRGECGEWFGRGVQSLLGHFWVLSVVGLSAGLA